jgi:hypothetical protein
MVIIYPDCIASLVLTYNCFCEGSVDCDIVIPTVILPHFVFGIIGNLVVECRPDNLFAISIVMTFQVGIRDEYWNRLSLGTEEVCDFRFLSGTQ